MNIVTIHAERYRAALTTFTEMPEFGVFIVDSMIHDTVRYVNIVHLPQHNSTRLTTLQRPLSTVTNDVVSITLPRLNEEMFLMFRDAFEMGQACFDECWQGSQAAHDCAKEMEIALKQIIAEAEEIQPEQTTSRKKLIA